MSITSSSGSTTGSEAIQARSSYAISSNFSSKEMSSSFHIVSNNLTLLGFFELVL